MDARDTFEMIPLFDEWKQLNAEIPKMQPCSKQVQAADFQTEMYYIRIVWSYSRGKM